MTPTGARLAQCFSSVFPNLSSAQIETASVESLESWDSIATVTLVATMEEEFACSVDLDDYAQLTSFAGCRQYLEARGSQPA